MIINLRAYSLSIRCILISFIAICAGSHYLHAQEVQFILPIDGIENKDFFIVNYVDHDSTSGIQDYECGTKTYDGHMGTDFVLRDFAQMDSGVHVFAAATGRIIFASDTLFDRNKATNPQGFGNYIAIQHTSGIVSYYSHLRKHSARVKVGDSVRSGDVIALVGSSGNSTDPHLHFEIWKNSKLTDPFAGSCYSQSRYWKQQPQYTTDRINIDHGLLSWFPTLDTLRERPSPQTQFGQKDTMICFWIQMTGARAGDSSHVEWYEPQGTLWSRFDYQHVPDLWYYYFWSYIAMPPTGMSGIWHVRYLLNKTILQEDSFTVSSTVSVSTDRFIPRTPNVRIIDNSILITNASDESPYTLELFSPLGSHLRRDEIITDRKGDAVFILPRVSKGIYFLRLTGKDVSTYHSVFIDIR